MKFETLYEKARNEICKNNYYFDIWTNTSSEYELALYNKFILELMGQNKDENYVKSCRWVVEQNAIQSKAHGRQHIKPILQDIYNNYHMKN